MKTIIALLLLALSFSAHAQNRLYYQPLSNRNYSLSYSNANAMWNWYVGVQSSSNLTDWRDAYFDKTNMLTVKGRSVGCVYYGRIQDNYAMFYRVSQTNLAPSITIQPIGTNYCISPTYKLEVSAFGSPPLWYQWMRDGVPIYGATNDYYVVVNSGGLRSNSYSVTVGNGLGMALSSSVFVKMDDIVNMWFMGSYHIAESNKPPSATSPWLSIYYDNGFKRMSLRSFNYVGTIDGYYKYISTNGMAVTFAITNMPLLSSIIGVLEFQSYRTGSYSFWTESSNLLGSGTFWRP